MSDAKGLLLNVTGGKSTDVATFSLNFFVKTPFNYRDISCSLKSIVQISLVLEINDRYKIRGTIVSSGPHSYPVFEYL